MTNEMKVSEELEVEWMTNLPDDLQLVQLNKLAIPGSHNSGAYNLTPELSPDAPSFLKTIGKFPGVGRFKSKLRKWCECQRLSIRDQLNLGIRYLDFRISSKLGSEDLYLIHALYGPKVTDALKEIQDFLDDHTKEVVIIDINHFYQMDSQKHQQLITLIKSTFGTKLLNRTSLDNVSLRSLMDSQTQVICFYHHQEGASDALMWPQECISSPWPNTKCPDVCISRLTHYMQRFSDLSSNVFSVCQGILTPDARYALTHMGKGGVYKMTQQLAPLLLSWLETSPSNWRDLPNIVIHDFVEECDYIPCVLALNSYRMKDRRQDQQPLEQEEQQQEDKQERRDSRQHQQHQQPQQQEKDQQKRLQQQQQQRQEGDLKQQQQQQQQHN